MRCRRSQVFQWQKNCTLKVLRLAIRIVYRNHNITHVILTFNQYKTKIATTIKFQSNIHVPFYNNFKKQKTDISWG